MASSCCFFCQESGKARLIHSEEDWELRLKTVNFVLRGARSVSLHQEFLIRSNHTDLQLLKIIKVSTFLYCSYQPSSHLSQDSGRNSITHNATVIANGLMHFGTTSDVFLRENLDWLKRASNWAKFTATASLGVIHYVRNSYVQVIFLKEILLCECLKFHLLFSYNLL